MSGNLIRNFLSATGNSIKIQETTKGAKAALQSKFQNLNAKVNQNVYNRRTDIVNP